MKLLLPLILLLMLVMCATACSKSKDDRCRPCEASSAYYGVMRANSCEGLTERNPDGSSIKWKCK